MPEITWADVLQICHNQLHGFIRSHANIPLDFRVGHIEGVLVRTSELATSEAGVCIDPPRCTTWGGERCNRKKRMGDVGLYRK